MEMLNAKRCRRRLLVALLLTGAACRGPLEDDWYQASEALMSIDGQALARIAFDTTVTVDFSQKWRLRLVALQALDRLELAAEVSSFVSCPGGVRLHARIVASSLPVGAQRTYGPWTMSDVAALFPTPVAAVRGGVRLGSRFSGFYTMSASDTLVRALIQPDGKFRSDFYGSGEVTADGALTALASICKSNDFRRIRTAPEGSLRLDGHTLSGTLLDSTFVGFPRVLSVARVEAIRWRRVSN